MLLIFLFSCTGRSPENIIKKERMIGVLTDMHIASAYATTFGDLDTIKQKTADYLNAIYIKHQTDSTSFRKSLEYYSEKPELLSKMYEQVHKNLEAKEKVLLELERLEQKRLAEIAKLREMVKRDSIRARSKTVLKPVIPTVWYPFKTSPLFTRKKPVKAGPILKK